MYIIRALYAYYSVPFLYLPPISQRNHPPNRMPSMARTHRDRFPRAETALRHGRKHQNLGDGRRRLETTVSTLNKYAVVRGLPKDRVNGTAIAR